jgi:hypothetical protein
MVKVAAGGQSKLAVWPDCFDAAFRENQANCRFAIHFSEESRDDNKRHNIP